MRRVEPKPDTYALSAVVRRLASATSTSLTGRPSCSASSSRLVRSAPVGHRRELVEDRLDDHRVEERDQHHGGGGERRPGQPPRGGPAPREQHQHGERRRTPRRAAERPRLRGVEQPAPPALRREAVADRRPGATDALVGSVASRTTRSTATVADEQPQRPPAAVRPGPRPRRRAGRPRASARAPAARRARRPCRDTRAGGSPRGTRSRGRSRAAVKSRCGAAADRATGHARRAASCHGVVSAIGTDQRAHRERAAQRRAARVRGHEPVRRARGPRRATRA